MTAIKGTQRNLVGCDWYGRRHWWSLWREHCPSFHRCPAPEATGKVLSSRRTVEQLRESLGRDGWVTVTMGDGTVLDFCPAHRPS